MGEERRVYKGLVGKAKVKKPLKRPRHRWEDGIMMDIREIGWEGVNWIHVAQDKDWWQDFVNMLVNLWVLVPWS
jgi:hypothetical protein